MTTYSYFAFRGLPRVRFASFNLRRTYSDRVNPTTSAAARSCFSSASEMPTGIGLEIESEFITES